MMGISSNMGAAHDNADALSNYAIPLIFPGGP